MQSPLESFFFSVPKTDYRLPVTVSESEDRDLSTAVSLSLQEDVKLKQTEAKLKQEATSYGFECKDVAHDGACFYSALADQMKLISQDNAPMTATTLRQLAQNHIRSNKAEYQPFIEGDIDQFIKKIKKPDEWVDNVEILALSRELKVNIIILRSDAQKPTIVKQSDNLPCAFVGYEVGLHYQSLIPLEEQNLNKDPQKDIRALITQTSADNVSTVKAIPFNSPKASHADRFSTDNAVKYGMLGLGAVGLFLLYKAHKEKAASLENNIFTTPAP